MRSKSDLMQSSQDSYKNGSGHNEMLIKLYTVHFLLPQAYIEEYLPNILIVLTDDLSRMKSFALITDLFLDNLDQRIK